MPEAETPEVETPEVETPEQEVLPFEELGDGFQEGQAAESGTSVKMQCLLPDHLRRWKIYRLCIPI